MRFVIFLAGAAMALSYFVTWIEPPFAGAEFSPAAMLGDSVAEIEAVVREGSWQVWVFLGGFAAAALSCILSLVTRGSGLLALLAGASPAVLIGYFYSRADQLQADLGLPFQVNFGDINQAYDLLGDFIRAGLWMYGVGAGILLLAGLVLTFGRS